MIKKLFSYSYGDFNIYIKRLLNFFSVFNGYIKHLLNFIRLHFGFSLHLQRSMPVLK